MLRRAVLVATLLGCTSPHRAADPAQTAMALAPPSPVRIELPASAEGWRGALETDARELETLLDQVLERWPREGTGELRLVVLPSPAAAVAWAERAGLAGDARVPRTHPRARLAVVPMVREDRLMTQRVVPPRTLRETIRHEMAHLLMLDRPGLAEAPRWFHEGLAEAWVGLREISAVDGRSHALGACWESALQDRAQARPAGAVQEVIAAMPIELQYTAWASLVLQCLAVDPGQRPWEAAVAHPSLASFLADRSAAALRAGAEAAPGSPGFLSRLPRPLGRDVDFVAGGRSVLLAAADGETVGLEARAWYGAEALRMRARVGRTGEPLAEILLGPPGAEQVARVRLNGFGGLVAAWESREAPPRRAHVGRLDAGDLDRWRDLDIRLLRREEWGHPDDLGESTHALLLQRSGGAFRALMPLPPGVEPRPDAPWLLEFRVRHGVFEVVGESPLIAALR